MNPALATDPRFGTLLARKEHEEELDRIVNEWTSKHTAQDVMALMQSAGVPAGMVENGADQTECPHLKSRHFFWEVERPERDGKYDLPAGHFLLSKTHYIVSRQPRLGEHNEYVFKQILGVSDNEYDYLVKDGVIG